MIRGLKHVIVPRLVDETLPQLQDRVLELIRGKNLVRERREGHVKVVRQLAVFELIRFGERLPDLLHVCGQCRFEVGERCCANVVSNDKEEERPLVSAGRNKLKCTDDEVGEGREDSPICSLLPEQTEIHFEHSLEQTHVGALVQADLMFPEVDYEDL